MSAALRLGRLSAGEQFANRYRLIEQLGQGGMGVVWRAHDATLDIEVALKFLHDLLSHDDEALDDLKRETRKALQLTHPHIVRVHSLVEDHERNLAGIAMEYVPGENLTKRRLKEPKRYLQPDQIGGWVRQLCEALFYAHEKAGIVHRDLKPANILLDARDEVRVTDFGISATASDSITRLTGAISNSGTLAYMSPQQAHGERPSRSDDLYALGSTIYELLTGKPPFYTGAILAQLMERKPPSIAERREELQGEKDSVSPAWEEVVASLLAKDPKDRPRDAQEVAVRLGLATPSTRSISASSSSGLRREDAAVYREEPTLFGAERIVVPPNPPTSSTIAPPVEAPVAIPEKKSRVAWPIWLGLAAVVVVVGTIAGLLLAGLSDSDRPSPVTTEQKAPPPISAVTTPVNVAAIEPAKATLPGKAIEPVREISPPAPPKAAPVQRTPGEWRVPEEQPTIRDAIAASEPGTVITIAPGTYTEFIELSDGVRLRGTDAKRCRITPPADAPCAILAVRAKRAIVENVTMDGSDVAAGSFVDAGWKLEVKRGQLVAGEVESSSPAAQAGVRSNVAVQKIGGVSVQSAEAAFALLNRKPNAPTIAVEWAESGVPLTTTMPLRRGVARAARSGIVAIDSSIEIRRCVVMNFAGTGVVIDGSQSAGRLVDSTLAGNSRFGALLVGAPIDVEKVRFENNAGGGLVAENIRGNPLISRSYFGGSEKGGGIVLNDTAATVRDSIVERNALDGIAVAGAMADVQIDTTIARANGAHGISFAGQAKGAITGNLSENNVGAGLAAIDSSTVVKARANRFTGNQRTAALKINGGTIED
jgi:serine/threonine protein kinase